MKTRPSLSPLPERPLLSVIIPSYNQGAFIRKTIESCLEQDYRPLEIVVMDGGSSDDTVDVLKSFGDLPELCWVSEPDDGVVDAVNKGLKKARGQIAAIQSSDDYYLPGCFSTVVNVFQANPRAGLVFGNVERVDAEGRTTDTNIQCTYSLSRLLARELFVYQPTAFFRLNLALDLGGWNPGIPYVPDFDLWFRLAFNAEVVQCEEVLGAYRTHPDQRDVNRDRIYANYLQMLKLSQDIAEAPPHLRRAAKAGAALLKFRYGGPWTHAQLTAAAWTAVWLRPSLIRSPLLPKHRLIPGYFALTRLRRKLLGPKGES
jgi:glycosyltransferase involved in cell wall biosynthesis